MIQRFRGLLSTFERASKIHGTVKLDGITTYDSERSDLSSYTKGIVSATTPGSLTALRFSSCSKIAWDTCWLLGTAITPAGK